MRACFYFGAGHTTDHLEVVQLYARSFSRRADLYFGAGHIIDYPHVVNLYGGTCPQRANLSTFKRRQGESTYDQ